MFADDGESAAVEEWRRGYVEAWKEVLDIIEKSSESTTDDLFDRAYEVIEMR